MFTSVSWSLHIVDTLHLTFKNTKRKYILKKEVAK